MDSYLRKSDSMSKISIIVAVYNVEPYINRCIDSILNQTYQNLEIILVDDGSPDNCGKICDQYADKDTRIRVIHKINGGSADAKNAGIDVATGEYLGIVDSDDFIHPKMYETLLMNLINTNSDISVCGWDCVYDNKMVADNRGDKIITMSNSKALEQFFTFSAIDYNVPWNKLYKIELFQGIRYPKGKTREDEFTTYKLIYESKKIVITKKVMYYYFQNENSVMHDKSLKIELDFADAMEDRIDFYAKKDNVLLYKRTLKRYCMWLIITAYMFQKMRRREPILYEVINKKRKEYIDRLLNEINMPFYSRLIYRLSKRWSYLTGFIAFQKMYRYNLLSKTAGFIFDDKISLKP